MADLGNDLEIVIVKMLEKCRILIFGSQTSDFEQLIHDEAEET